MLKKLLSLLLIWTVFGTFPAYAVIDPLSVPNNRVGVHVLDTSEVEQAAKLVNSNNGDWGYVTVVIRSNDLDREKWIRFFTDCRRLHLIPIVRLATYPDGGVWVRPDALDLVDFANFLADMPWPVKNRYLVIFNEVNHAAEWGGRVDPLDYATLLLDAKRIFKERSDNFFLLSAGLDMSAPQDNQYWDALNYLRQISRLQPKWYEAIDGISVHAYPNPAFSSTPASASRYGISSFKYETDLLKSLGYPAKPIFITETGWPHERSFFTEAFQVWSDPNIVAITPFLLYAGSGDFARFSLLDSNQAPKPAYREIYDLQKERGSPLQVETVITSYNAYSSGQTSGSSITLLWNKVKSFWLSLFKQTRLTVGETEFGVEIAQTEAERQQGLSGRNQLADKHGMLFIFDKPDQHSFWMYHMNFALDFIWIRGGKIVEITTEVLPPSQTGGEPQVIIPGVKVDQVLEVTAGTVDKYGIKMGDIVRR